MASRVSQAAGPAHCRTRSEALNFHQEVQGLSLPSYCQLTLFSTQIWIARDSRCFQPFLRPLTPGAFPDPCLPYPVRIHPTSRDKAWLCWMTPLCSLGPPVHTCRKVLKLFFQTNTVLSRRGLGHLSWGNLFLPSLVYPNFFFSSLPSPLQWAAFSYLALTRWLEMWDDLERFKGNRALRAVREELSPVRGLHVVLAWVLLVVESDGWGGGPPPSSPGALLGKGFVLFSSVSVMLSGRDSINTQWREKSEGQWDIVALRLLHFIKGTSPNLSVFEFQRSLPVFYVHIIPPSLRLQGGCVGLPVQTNKLCPWPQTLLSPPEHSSYNHLPHCSPSQTLCRLLLLSP